MIVSDAARCATAPSVRIPFSGDIPLLNGKGKPRAKRLTDRGPPPTCLYSPVALGVSQCCYGQYIRGGAGGTSVARGAGSGSWHLPTWLAPSGQAGPGAGSHRPEGIQLIDLKRLDYCLAADLSGEVLTKTEENAKISMLPAGLAGQAGITGPNGPERLQARYRL